MLTGRDAMSDDLGRDGGKVRKLEGRDWYVAHLNDSVAPLRDNSSTADSADTSRDHSGADSRGPGYWIADLPALAERWAGTMTREWGLRLLRPREHSNG